MGLRSNINWVMEEASRLMKQTDGLTYMEAVEIIKVATLVRLSEPIHDRRDEEGTYLDVRGSVSTR